MILVIDNYDSFVHNLARYIRLLGFPTDVRRQDEISVEDVLAMAPHAIVISPGPGTPRETPGAMQIVSRFASEIPMLGICLGHQVLVEALGGLVIRAPQPVHGSSSSIEHDGFGIFEKIPSPMTVGRYHSLIAAADCLPACLQIQARTAEGIPMAVRHRLWPLVGLQFHPESVLTEHGSQLLGNFFGNVVGITGGRGSEDSSVVRRMEVGGGADPPQLHFESPAR